MRGMRVTHVMPVIRRTPIPRIVFGLSVVHVMRVLHVTRVRRPIPFSLIILFLGVMRVMDVIHVMTPTPVSPRIFGVSIMLVMCVVLCMLCPL